MSIIHFSNAVVGIQSDHVLIAGGDGTESGFSKTVSYGSITPNNLNNIPFRFVKTNNSTGQCILNLEQEGLPQGYWSIFSFQRTDIVGALVELTSQSADSYISVAGSSQWIWNNIGVTRFISGGTYDVKFRA